MSSSWTQDYDAVFWITLCTILCGSLGLAMKLCMKSKCENLSLCCGLVEVHRNVELELASEIAAAGTNNGSRVSSSQSNPSTPSRPTLAEDNISLMV